MILKEIDAEKKLKHPMNMFNGMRKSNNSALSIFIKPNLEVKKEEFVNPFEKKDKINDKKESNLAVVTNLIPSDEINKNEGTEPSIDELTTTADYDIKLQEAHNQAIDVLSSSLKELAVKVPELGAKQLADTAAKAMRVIESVRKEKLERAKINNGSDNSVHFHFYNPQSKLISNFEVIDVEASSPSL